MVVIRCTPCSLQQDNRTVFITQGLSIIRFFQTDKNPGKQVTWNWSSITETPQTMEGGHRFVEDKMKIFLSLVEYYI